MTEARGVRLVVTLLGEGWSEEILRFLAGGSPFVESGRTNAGGRKGFIVYAAKKLLAFRWRRSHCESEGGLWSRKRKLPATRSGSREKHASIARRHVMVFTSLSEPWTTPYHATMSRLNLHYSATDRRTSLRPICVYSHLGCCVVTCMQQCILKRRLFESSAYRGPLKSSYRSKR